jgi:meso-butanediol dehydrogenase/(S,S)-butanediol dehydrogenase/diacetyl reductase
MKRFEGKYALVTGAASGIGLATAVRLAEEGAAGVAVVDINENVKETAAKVEALGAKTLALTCDISSVEQVTQTVAAVIAAFDRLDVLCNVAGILRADHTIELKDENWDKVIRTNLYGTFYMCRAALPHLVKTKGAIVNTSSAAALGHHPWMAAYAASKGGILSMTRSIAVEYAKQGVRANSVCPGGVATPLHGQFRLPKGADPALLRSALPWNGYASPEQIAAVNAFLASDDAAYISGEDIRADGGASS